MYYSQRTQVHRTSKGLKGLVGSVSLDTDGMSLETFQLLGDTWTLKLSFTLKRLQISNTGISKQKFHDIPISTHKNKQKNRQIK